MLYYIILHYIAIIGLEGALPPGASGGGRPDPGLLEPEGRRRGRTVIIIIT